MWHRNPPACHGPIAAIGRPSDGPSRGQPAEPWSNLQSMVKPWSNQGPMVKIKAQAAVSRRSRGQRSNPQSMVKSADHDQWSNKGRMVKLRASGQIRVQWPNQGPSPGHSGAEFRAATREIRAKFSQRIRSSRIHVRVRQRPKCGQTVVKIWSRCRENGQNIGKMVKISGASNHRNSCTSMA